MTVLDPFCGVTGMDAAARLGSVWTASGLILTRYIARRQGGDFGCCDPYTVVVRYTGPRASLDKTNMPVATIPPRS